MRREKGELKYRIGRNDGGRKVASRGEIGEEGGGAGRRRIGCIHYHGMEVRFRNRSEKERTWPLSCALLSVTLTH